MNSHGNDNVCTCPTCCPGKWEVNKAFAERFKNNKTVETPTVTVNSGWQYPCPAAKCPCPNCPSNQPPQYPPPLDPSIRCNCHEPLYMSIPPEGVWSTCPVHGTRLVRGPSITYTIDTQTQGIVIDDKTWQSWNNNSEPGITYGNWVFQDRDYQKL